MAFKSSKPMKFLVRYSLENGKARYAECSSYTPMDALYWLVRTEHICKGATVRLGLSMWDDDIYVCGCITYRHRAELDKEQLSAWELVGSGIIQYIRAKPE